MKQVFNRALIRDKPCGDEWRSILNSCLSVHFVLNLLKTPPLKININKDIKNIEQIMIP